MKYYIFLILIFILFASCRTTNVLVPICVEQHIQNIDERVDFSFDINEAFWDMSIHNYNNAEIKVDYNKIRLFMSNQNSASGSITKTVPAKGILYILPNTKNSKLLYPRYSVRRNLFTPKDIKNKGIINLILHVPVEYQNEIKEYHFNFTLKQCESNQQKYADEIYN